MISAATNDYYVHNSSESIKASCTSIFVLPNGGKKCRRYRRYPMEVLLALHLGNSEEHFGVQHRKSFSVARANLFHICVAELEIEDIDVLCQSGL